MNLSERLRPKTLAEYGESTAATVAKNYVESCLAGNPIASAVLLYGAPGSGKSTLVRCVARSCGGLALVETNASMDHSKEKLHAVFDSMLTMPLSGTAKVFFLDEIDALSTKQQKMLVDMLGKTKDPVFLACNDFGQIEKELRAECLCIEVSLPTEQRLKQVAQAVANETKDGGWLKYAERAKSYRDLFALFDSKGDADVDDALPDEAAERIKRFMRGEESYLRPSEFWGVGAWVIDNTVGQEAADFDMWQARYRKVGSRVEPFLIDSLRAVRCVDPQFPWSVTVGREKAVPKKKEKKEPAPKPEKKTKKPKTAPPKPKKTDDWF